MPKPVRFGGCLVLLASAVCLPAQTISLSDLSKLDLRNASAETTSYRGGPALKMTWKQGEQNGYAAVKGSSFHNGTIDVEVAGTPAKGAGEGARGFIGVIFRMSPDGSKQEVMYIRPTNGRASDQLRRNHSTQYVSVPDWPWERLRKESPGVYESYADMVPGEWTRLRIVVKGADASLFVGAAEQPCLLVHDLKLGDAQGLVGLWIGPGTEGYFRNLKITAENGKPR